VKSRLPAVVYTEADDCVHPSDDDPRWQESSFLAWWADDAGVGGIHRIGHEPNRDVANVAIGVFSRDGWRYRRNEEGVPLRADLHTDDRLGAGALGGEPGLQVFTAGGPRFLVVDEPGCELELDFHDYHPRFDYWALTREEAHREPFARGHFQVTGGVQGRLRLGDSTYDFKGVGHRDHSWGPRDWWLTNSHRQLCGGHGPDLTFAVMTVHLDNGIVTRQGHVMRDNEIAIATEMDVVVHTEIDGFSHRRAEAHMVLDDGTEHDVAVDVQDATSWCCHEFWSVDGLGPVEIDGRSGGGGDAAISTNALRGRIPPSLAVRACITNGLTRRPPA
jgi:hypothetical protein